MNNNKLFLVVGVCLLLVSVPVSASSDLSKYLRPAEVPAPAINKTTPQRAELGKMLFFDPRLSGSNWISCATCHNPALGWSDGLPTAIGHGMKVLERSTPTILNTAYNRLQMWDGRFNSLEEQALGPIEARGEMNQNLGDAINELKKIKGYVPLFEQAYPGEGISEDTVAKAIAAFERTIVSGEASFDRWIKGDKKAMSAAAVRGFKLFEGKANCTACHQNFNFMDDGFHNIGLKGNTDLGRYAKKPIKLMKGAFKTPTLRNIALTAPYMHNGAYNTLTEVVQHYNRGGDPVENLDPNMKKLNLSNKEVGDIVAFLEALTDDAPGIHVPQLPQ